MLVLPPFVPWGQAWPPLAFGGSSVRMLLSNGFLGQRVGDPNGARSLVSSRVRPLSSTVATTSRRVGDGPKATQSAALPSEPWLIRSTGLNEIRWGRSKFLPTPNGAPRPTAP